MSNKICGFTVIFENSVSEEYMDRVRNAISIIDGVAKVEPVIESADAFIGASQESHRIKMFLIDAVKKDFKI